MAYEEQNLSTAYQQHLLNRKNPNIWLTPIYTQWAQIGIMCLIYVFLPESPAWCVSRGNADGAKKQLLRLNRGVFDYDEEHQYQTIVQTFGHEREVAAGQKKEHCHRNSGSHPQNNGDFKHLCLVYVGMISNGAAGVVMNVLTPYMVNANKWNWGFKTGWFYAGVGLPFLIGTWLLLTDISGRSAADVDELFERKVKP
ncbi:maltose permease [Fusarium napiforme]|uniref:Maltose permease n=1 Tax=Fusarium napiforme TaxID=42672 RepID=A0A8H5I3B0_9HYPO|nr:maltose permease [Fusarium napiforme]